MYGIPIENGVLTLGDNEIELVAQTDEDDPHGYFCSFVDGHDEQFVAYRHTNGNVYMVQQCMIDGDSSTYDMSLDDTTICRRINMPMTESTPKHLVFGFHDFPVFTYVYPMIVERVEIVRVLYFYDTRVPVVYEYKFAGAPDICYWDISSSVILFRKGTRFGWTRAIIGSTL